MKTTTCGRLPRTVNDVNQEGMDDRYYFSDWGGCTCYDLNGEHHEGCPFEDGEHEEDEDQ